MVLSTSTMLTGWVYDTPPGDLKVQNEKTLLAMGVSQASVDHLLRHRWYTLTLQTALVRGLDRLGGVAGRPDVMPLALTVESEEQARFVVGAVEMLARYHATVRPLGGLEVRGTVLGRPKAGGLVVPGPVDYVAWTEGLARFAQRPDLKAPGREIWLSGRASPRAGQELSRLGWKVQEHALLAPASPATR